MTKEEIDDIKIEHRGEQKYWNITMFVEPMRGNKNVPCYADLVDLAENIICMAKGLGRDWFPSNAEVMAWSAKDSRGILTPHRFRVTLDMITKDMEGTPQEE